jgi:hypothetical protein
MLHRQTLLLVLFGATLSLAACGDKDTDDDGGGSTGDSSGGSPSGGGPSGGSPSGGGTSGGNTTSGMMETCESSHVCINGACTCETPGKQGQPCSDEVACEAECKVCS